jgi:hypothetical protein
MDGRSDIEGVKQAAPVQEDWAMVMSPVPHGGKKGPFRGHMCNPGVRRGPWARVGLKAA